jgi:NAD(P)-dependent dehydrogenase (short-subunit alcohol dehydrogenase family)
LLAGLLGPAATLAGVNYFLLRLEAAVTETGSGNAVGLQAGSRKLTDLDRVYSRIKQLAGTLDVVFANAGGGGILPLTSITEEQFDDIVGRNVREVESDADSVRAA